MKRAFMTIAAAACIAGATPAMACSQDDCGTVRATGFGDQCEWVLLESTVHAGSITTYGVPLNSIKRGLIAATAIKGGPYAIHSGSLFTCRGAQVPIVVYGSNDPAEQQ